MGDEKMSKSLGNVKLIHDLLKDWDGEVIRLALLKAHYRSELTWTEDLLKESKENLDGWYRKTQLAEKILESSPEKIIYTDTLGVGDILSDLDLATILAALSLLARNLQSRMELLADDYDVEDLSGPNRENVTSLLNDIGTLRENLLDGFQFLGLLQKDPEDCFKGGVSAEEETEFDAIALRREQARAQKDWAAADAARDEATAKGIVLEDGPDGTTWRKA